MKKKYLIIILIVIIVSSLSSTLATSNSSNSYISTKHPIANLTSNNSKNSSITISAAGDCTLGIIVNI